MRRAKVVTSRIAVDGELGRHLLVADTPAESADAIIGQVESPERRRRLSGAGRKRMLSHHAWSRSMERLDGIVERCVRGFARLSAGMTARV